MPSLKSPILNPTSGAGIIAAMHERWMDLVAVALLLVAGAAACQFEKPPDVAGEAGPPRRTLTVTADGPGTVNSQPAGINCAGDTCTAQFDDGATVNLTAEGQRRRAVLRRTAALCAGPQPTCAVAMTEDRTVTATFASFQCTPNTTTCTQQQLVVCDGNGAAQVTPCLFGCHPSGTRCYDLAPSNVGIAACLDASAVEPDATIPDGSTINTDDGTIRTAGGTPINVASEAIAAPTDGVGVRCFRVNKLTIGQTTVVGARALTIAANGDVTITGHVSVSARAFDQPGPGAYLVDASCAGGPRNRRRLSPFGGRWRRWIRRAGGRGGSGAGGANAGTPGPINGTLELVPLRGGCRGGISAASTIWNAAGALQISTRGAIILQEGAGISANGFGGGSASAQGPYGGGSGGGVLLESSTVIQASASFLVANGGGGGGRMPGEGGRLDATPAAGGPGTTSSPWWAAGGSGAAGLSAAQPGDTTVNDGMGGGGGGGAGRIRVNTMESVRCPGAAIVSPPAATARARPPLSNG